MAPCPCRSVAVAFAALVSGLALAAPSAAAQERTDTTREQAADLVREGDEARCARDAQAALTDFQGALALDSLDYEANWKAARELTDLGKLMPDSQRSARDSVYAEALALARRAVRADSMGSYGHYMVAVAVGREALTKSARERVKSAGVVRDEALRAIALDSTNDAAMHVMGRWNAEIMRLSGLSRFFARTFLGASVFREASWDNAVRFLRDAIRLDPQNLYHHLDLAETLIDAGRPAQARLELEEVGQLPLGCDLGDPTYKQRAAELLQKIGGAGGPPATRTGP
jgi:tetratricopeptide (TPR) repeat protein